MIIYGSTLSPFVRKVAAYCHERGIAFDNVVGTPGQPSDEFIAASPMRKIPALRDGDFTLADSSAIIHYLEAEYPEGRLIPDAPQARGRTIWFEEWADTALVGCGAKIFFNRFVAPRVLGRPGDEAMAAAAERDELPRLLDYLEGVVPDAGGFLVDDRLTLADLAVASPFVNFDHLGMDLSARYPRIHAYARAVLSRPSFAPLIEREREVVARLPAAAA